MTRTQDQLITAARRRDKRINTRKWLINLHELVELYQYSKYAIYRQCTVTFRTIYLSKMSPTAGTAIAVK